MLDATIIGNRISEARKKRQLSQAQLAKELFITPQAIGKWERGESLPDILQLNRLAVIFQVDLNYFGEQEPKSEENSINPIEKNIKKEVETPTKNVYWNMSQGNWVDANFSGLTQVKDKFSHSNIKNCQFVASDLSLLALKGNNIQKSNFTQSNLNSCHFEGSNIDTNDFSNCTFNSAQMNENNIVNCNFYNANFKDATFTRNMFSKNDITGSVWKNTTFIGTHFDQLVFQGKITDCIFENCGFYRVLFENVVLTNTFFKNNKNMKRVQFVNCSADRMTLEFLRIGKVDITNIAVIVG